MLNGATMKLRSAQASRTKVSTKRAVLQPLSLGRSSGTAAAASRLPRRDNGERIGRACFRPRLRGQAGVAFAPAPIMRLGDGSEAAKGRCPSARRAVRGRARPAEPVELRGGG